MEGALGALAEYQSVISGLVSAMSLVPPLRTAAGQTADAVRHCRSTHMSAAEDAASDNAAALSLRAKADAARAALTQEAQEIIDEVRRLDRRLVDATQALKRLGAEHDDLTARRIKAAMTLGCRPRRPPSALILASPRPNVAEPKIVSAMLLPAVA